MTTGAVVGSLGRQVASGWCAPVSWWTASSILAVCWDADPTTLWDSGSADLTQSLDLSPRLVTFDMSQIATGTGAVLRPLVAGDIVPWRSGSAWVSDAVAALQGAVVTAGPDACSDGAYLLRGRELTRIVGPDVDPRSPANLFAATASVGTVVVRSEGGCSGDAVPLTLSSYDLATGATTVLLGSPDPVAAGDFWQGISSYAVGR